MSALLEILAAVLLIAGAGIVAMAALGVARLPDPFTRMHAAAKAGVGGAGLLLLGTGLAFGTTGALVTSVAAIAFLVLTAPLASHALGRAAYVAGAPISAATLSDALQGVLDRKVFDIDPARTARPRLSARDALGKEAAMSAIPEFRRPDDLAARAQPSADPVALRRILCCLPGGNAQGEANLVALDLARAAGAQLVGLSGAGLEPRRWGGPLGVGGAFWAEWAASRNRARVRATAAAALQDFQALAAAAPGLDVTARHEEADPAALSRLLAGHDLVVVPAGATADGLEGEVCEEIAATLAAARIAPVLRVRRRPARVREVVMLVGPAPGSGALAAGFLRSGLWPQAGVAILPLGAGAAEVMQMAQAQAELLRAHGRRATVLAPLDPSGAMAELRVVVGRCDAAVMATLSGRGGGVLDSLRSCAHEVTAETVAVTLLP